MTKTYFLELYSRSGPQAGYKAYSFATLTELKAFVNKWLVKAGSPFMNRIKEVYRTSGNKDIHLTATLVTTLTIKIS